MSSCEAIQLWLSARLDGEATEEEQAAVEEHLAACSHCRAEAERLKDLKVLVGQGLADAPVPSVPLGFASSIAARARPTRRWTLVWAALAAATAGAVLAWFLATQPERQELMSVYELKPVEVVAARKEPPPIMRYLEVHVREASAVPPVDAQGLVEYVGFRR